MSAINVTIICQFDAELRQMRMQFLDPSTGEVVGNLPQVRLDLRDMREATSIDGEHVVEMLCRQTHFTSALDGSKKRCWVLATIPESDATPLASASEVEDLYLGGGGGGDCPDA